MNANEIIIPCRLSYSHIWEPASVNGSAPKYSVCCLMEKSDTKTLQRLETLIKRVIQESAAKWGGKIPPNLKLPLRDGDTERDDENYAGCMFLNANSSHAPAVIDARCQPVMDQDEVYSGCYANVKISVYAFNANGSRGIGCGLVAVQKVRDGERLAGSSGTDGFEAIEADSTDDFSYLG